MTAPKFPSLMCEMGENNSTTLENISAIFTPVPGTQEAPHVSWHAGTGKASRACEGVQWALQCIARHFKFVSLLRGNVREHGECLSHSSCPVSLLQIPSRTLRADGDTGALDGEPEERLPPWAKQHCQNHPSPLHPWLVTNESCADGRRKPHHQHLQNEC